MSAPPSEPAAPDHAASPPSEDVLAHAAARIAEAYPDLYGHQRSGVAAPRPAASARRTSRATRWPRRPPPRVRKGSRMRLAPSRRDFRTLQSRSLTGTIGARPAPGGLHHAFERAA